MYTTRVLLLDGSMLANVQALTESTRVEPVWYSGTASEERGF